MGRRLAGAVHEERPYFPKEHQIRSGETTVTVVGNLVADPLSCDSPHRGCGREFHGGVHAEEFRPGQANGRTGICCFLRANLWRQPPPRNVAETLRKGRRVIVTGRLRQRTFEIGAGERRTVTGLEVDEIGPSLGVRDRHRRQGRQGNRRQEHGREQRDSDESQF